MIIIYIYLFLGIAFISILKSKIVPLYDKIIVFGLFLFWVYQFGKRHNFNWGAFFNRVVICSFRLTIFIALVLVVLHLLFPHMFPLKIY